MLSIVMDNVIKQRMKGDTRFRGEDTPSMLNLLCTKEWDIVRKIRYGCSMGNSDHVMIECTVTEPRGEQYKRGSFNYG